MGWTTPNVVGSMGGGLLLLAIFAVIETRIADPMFRLGLFRIRAFTAGNIATLLASLGRGGLMFMLIMWLQGIWLPLHGYSFADTPLWAGIYMLPLTVGFLIAGPVSGYLSDHFGARPFATGGMLVAALSFFLLELLPVNFNYVWFSLLLLMVGLGMGLFSSPNQAGIMNSLPANRRGVGRRHGHDVPELGDRALDRHLLLAHDRGPCERRCPARSTTGSSPRACRGGRGPHLPPAAGRAAVRLVPGLQPDAAAARAGAAAHLPRARRLPDGPHVLPQADRRSRSRTGCTRRSTSRSPRASSPRRASWLRGGKYVHGVEEGEQTLPVVESLEGEMALAEGD